MRLWHMASPSWSERVFSCVIYPLSFVNARAHSAADVPQFGTSYIRFIFRLGDGYRKGGEIAPIFTGFQPNGEYGLDFVREYEQIILCPLFRFNLFSEGLKLL